MIYKYARRRQVNIKRLAGRLQKNINSPTIIKPLSSIFLNSLKSNTFLDDWRKGNIVPVFKKTVNNLLIINVFCHCYLNARKCLRSSHLIAFNLMNENNLLKSCQSVFRPNDFCAYHLFQ